MKKDENLSPEQKTMISEKMEELRKCSHSKVTDDKLKRGAMIALGLN